MRKLKELSMIWQIKNLTVGAKKCGKIDDTNLTKKHVMPKRPIAMYSKTVSPILQKNVYSHSLIIKADRLWSRGRGFELRHHILDGCKIKDQT
jgi:hypothetical protein